MKNAVIYARFSSHGQNEQTIDGQVNICRDYAERMGLHVIKVYEEKAKTGTNDHRPAFQAMIRDAMGDNFQYIIVYMLDRFARNRRDSIMYKEMLKQEHGIRVLSATQQISDDEGGELYEMFTEWNDEKYSKRLSKRVHNGLDMSVENGTFTGGHLLYGYKLVDTDRKGKSGTIHKVEIDEPKAAIIRYVFTEYAKGVDKKDIAHALNTKGERFNGKPFHFRSFDNWLYNRKYTGKFNLGKRVCDKQYPPIIDETTFEKVQQRLHRNRHLAGANSAIEPYYLSGKAICGYCNAPMTSGGGRSHTGHRYYYYVCHRKRKNQCHKTRIEKDKLEKIVTLQVQDFLHDPVNADRAANDTIAFYNQRTSLDEIKSIDTRIAIATKEIEKAATAFIDAESRILRDTIEKKMKEYEILLADLQKQKSQLELERGQEITKDDILDFIAELLQGNPNDKEYQRKLIDNLVLSVLVYNDGIATNIKFGADMSVKKERERATKCLQDYLFKVQSQTSMLCQTNYYRIRSLTYRLFSSALMFVIL